MKLVKAGAIWRGIDTEPTRGHDNENLAVCGLALVLMAGAADHAVKQVKAGAI